MSAMRRRIGAWARHLMPRPEVAAYRRLVRHASRVPRRAAGRLRLGPYTIHYTDALTLCPQWEDIFVRETMRFSCHREDPRILDCGANVGLASLWFKKTWPKARVTAFEADPTIAACLRQNMAGASVDVEVIQAAVWTHDGQVAFDCEGADAGAVSEAGTAETHVPAVRLRDALGEPIDLLKLDIEGAEFAVLEDCASHLEHVRSLFAEIHEFDPTHRRAHEALSVLTQCGFDYVIDEFVPMPWRATAGPDSAFPQAATHWAFVVRAWRPGR